MNRPSTEEVVSSVALVAAMVAIMALVFVVIYAVAPGDKAGPLDPNPTTTTRPLPTTEGE